MNEEFKVKFTVDLGDAQRKVEDFKDDLKSTEKVKLKVNHNIGDINREANQVFGTLRKRIAEVNKNPIWSQAKKSEFVSFFKAMESTAYKSLSNIEKRYSTLSQELSVFGIQRETLKEAISQRDIQSDLIRKQIEDEMSKTRVKTPADLIKMQKEYNSLVQEVKAYQKAAKEALSQGDEAGYESLASRINELESYRKTLIQDISTFRVGEPIGEQPDPEKIAKLQEEWNKVVGEAEQLEEELSKMESDPAIEKKRQELEAMGAQYQLIINDLQQNPIKFASESDALKPLNYQAENLNNNLDRTGQKLRATNKLSEGWDKIMSRIKHRMMFSFISFINPINIARKAWSGFLQQNQKTANTFKMIGQNLQRVLEPAMRQVANWMLKAAQYANIFTKAWFNVDLFDKSVLSSQKTKENMEAMNKLTTGFDELNMFTEKQETLDESELPTIDQKLSDKLTDWASSGTGKAIGDALHWALEHPIETAAIALGTKFVGGLIGKGIAKLAGNKIAKWLGTATGEAGAQAAAGGAATGTLWATKFGTAVKAGTGVALVAAGSALTGYTSRNLTKYWETMGTGEKVLNGVGAAAGVAAAGLGGYVAAGALVGSTAGPIGAAIGAGIAGFVGITVSAFTARDSILSVKKAQEQYDEALETSAEAQSSYLNAVSDLAMTMNNLEELERQTGLSGEALAEQVDRGALSIDKMTSAQLAVYSAYIQNQQALENSRIATENARIATENEIKTNMELQLSNAQKSKSYDDLKSHILQMYNEGKISSDEAATYMNRAMGSMSGKARETFMEDVPDAIREGLDPKKYQAWGRSLISWFGDLFGGIGKGIGNFFQSVGNWVSGKGFKTNEQLGVNSFAVGTNYVPNDQLAYIHKGEAIVPAKYNNPSTFGGDTSALRETLNAMNSEISNLRNTIAQGIPVSGTFTQRGSDLVAVVDRTKSKNGSQPLSNAAFAR